MTFERMLRLVLSVGNLLKSHLSRKTEKTVSKMFMKRLGASVMTAVAFATFGCGGALIEQGASSDVVRRAPLAGRALYQGMFFGVGPAAQLFPEIWENEDLKARIQRQGREGEFETAANAVSDMIAGQDPAFFDRFAAGIQSGDHLLIEQTMKDARQQTHVAVAAMRGVPVDQVGQMGVQAQEMAVWLYVETAVAVVAVAIALLVVIDISLTDGPVAQGRLGMDAWVDILARKDFSAQAP